MGTSHAMAGSLDPSTTYHWRVTSHNVCGDTVATSSSFTTVLLLCATHSSSDVPKSIPEGGGTS